MTYADAEAYLLSLPRFTDQGAGAYQPGLARMEALMDAMGRPHEAFPSVHVAGTNGKGSTASLIAAVGMAAGHRVGLHTSPHLFHLAERLRLDGVPAPEAWIAGAVRRFRAVMEEVRPSFFEATVALSFLYFAEQAVDLAVVEVGMGGRLDATNVLHPRLAVITHIGLDHTDFLGDTPALIAREKAGIIKPGVPVLTAATQPEVLETLADVAGRQGAPLHRVQEEVDVREAATSTDGLTLQVRSPLRSYDDLVVGLPGRHQEGNALLALRAAELLFEAVRREARPVYAGLRDVRRLSGLRGRLDVLHRRPLIVADVSHNAEGLATALHFVRQAMPEPAGRLFVLFGVMRDKDAGRMARLLAEARATVWPLRLATERALPPEELAFLLTRYGVHVGDVHDAPPTLDHFRHEASSHDALLITGSHLVVARLGEQVAAHPPGPSD